MGKNDITKSLEEFLRQYNIHPDSKLLYLTENEEKYKNVLDALGVIEKEYGGFLEIERFSNYAYFGFTIYRKGNYDVPLVSVIFRRLYEYGIVYEKQFNPDVLMN